ncbi:MAG: gamma-glutamyltranspeptidase/glutathione hydrolase [Chlamydiales bacterium]|jgi:gamma-glutamyltranspeptidase/glutathione hydrolase
MSLWQKSRNLIPSVITLFLFINFSSCSSAHKKETSYQNGMVVSTHSIASKVGIDILKKGGNAIDAAVAVSYALSVVYPEAGNIGGGGFMLIRYNDGGTTAIDFRETAPGKSNRDMYLDIEGKVIPELSTVGALSVGVPGTVAGTIYALEKYGSMSREEVIRPSIELAEAGWVLDRPLGGDEFKRFPSSNAIFNKADGTPYQKGDVFIQKDLAKTLRLISEKGHQGFYSGEVAEKLIDTMQKYNGLITRQDLNDYQVVERAPVRGTYRGYEIISMSPPSSGGLCLIELLNILERYDIQALGWNTPETIHLVAEAERRAYADRAEFLGDPDFVVIPTLKLLSKKFADRRAQDIDLKKATPSYLVTHGKLNPVAHEKEETTHYSIVDKQGTCVSVTTTLNGSFGSYLSVEGGGFLLNNEMDDFSAKPGEPNMYGLLGGDANAIEPHKRMLSSMAPTILTKNGNNFMVIGTPGGSTIITTVLQCIMNVVDHKMSIQEAVEAPRFHHQWYPDTIQYEEEKSTISMSTKKKLKSLGHDLSGRGNIGDAHGILIDPLSQTFKGGADPRGAVSAALGY